MKWSENYHKTASVNKIVSFFIKRFYMLQKLTEYLLKIISAITVFYQKMLSNL